MSTNKREAVIKKIKQTFNVGEDDAVDIFRAVTESVSAALVEEGDTLRIGCGTLAVRRRESRPCRNIQTGEPMMSKPRLFLKFTESSTRRA